MILITSYQNILLLTKKRLASEKLIGFVKIYCYSQKKRLASENIFEKIDWICKKRLSKYIVTHT